MKIIHVMLIMLIFSACQESEKINVQSEKIIESKQVLKGIYFSLGENLYADSSGNIFFRTID